MNNKQSATIRIILSILVLIVMSGLLFVLRRPASNTVSVDSRLPMIGSSPIYVEMEDGVKLTRNIRFDEDTHIGGIEVLLVNTGDAGTITVSLNDTQATADIANIPVGEWVSIGIDTYLEAGREYELSFTPTGAAPYFMEVEGYDLDISAGYDIITDKAVTYGDIFYFSIPITAFISVLIILLILGGHDRVIKAVQSLNLISFFRGFGCEVFMVLLFVVLALKIYSTAYINGVYITADSDGYLREAVNLVAGNGYSYDGLAGYNSWFANWPIIYPAMIAGVMMITGCNAYLSSKIVAIIVIALIEVVLYITYRKQSWIYALALTNLGFLGLAYHTWSEVPFILFMLIFGISLGKVVTTDSPSLLVYITLGLSGTATFLTRYFGIYVWFVAGLYWLLLLAGMLIEHKKSGKWSGLRRVVSLAVTAAISGIICLAYLVMNKVMNGNPTGVSRGTWWDDYHTLTDDLIGSLVTEIFNVFSLEVPKDIASLPYDMKAVFVIMVSIGVGVLIHYCLNRREKINNRNQNSSEVDWFARYMGVDQVMIVMAIVYYGMFIVIRYRSSMDTFYFRFFEPATFLLTIGLIGLMLHSGMRAGTPIAVFVTVMTIISGIATIRDCDWSHERDYYDITCNTWDNSYEGIPDHSVVIWSSLDYRSTWYRPDVIAGELYESDTMDTLKERYYGSRYMCISNEYVDAILREGDYDESVKSAIADAAFNTAIVDGFNGYDSNYVSVSLR